MTNLPTGTTETTPTTTTTRRRRLNRVITVSALAAGALTAFAAPAQAATAHHPGRTAVVHGTGSRTVTDPRNCGGRHHFAMSGFNRFTANGPRCTPENSPAAPATPAASTSPSTPSSTRGGTINYNEGYAGSCVYYALERFHQYTGVYPRAFGDARYLATGAAASGWATGSTPRINSLVVFQPGQNGAGSPTGHVAWVEQVSGNQIYIGEMNAPTAYVVTHRWMTPVSGVRYVYA
jgi:surface antigen